jgi:hypothetical protein
MDWSGALSPGERGIVLILARNTDQATVAFRYVSAIFDLPAFNRFVTRRTSNTIELGRNKSRLSYAPTKAHRFAV